MDSFPINDMYQVEYAEPNRYSLTKDVIPNSELRQRISHSWRQIDLAQQLSQHWLAKLPWIECVAVSGSVSALNATTDADVDLFIITKPNRAWLTRSSVLILLTLSRKRTRIRHHHSNAGRYCLNLITTTDAPPWQSQQQDLYTAMEIAHLKVVYNRNRAFQNFLWQNQWLQSFLPNYWQMANHEWNLETHNTVNHQDKPRRLNRIIAVGWQKMENICEKTQSIWYQRRHHQSLTLDSTWPVDHRRSILNRYETVLRQHSFE